MPVEMEPRHAPARTRAAPYPRAGEGPIVIGLVNNMPDAALHSTETQFAGLLQQASGELLVRLRLSSIRELPRAAE